MRFEQLEPRTMLATLLGTSGDDVFSAGPGWATLNDVNYIGDYDFDGGAGQDTVSLYDTPGDDVFTVGPGMASLGAISVVNSEVIHGYAKAGGYDTALMTGTTGVDEATAKVYYAKLISDDFFLRAKFFENVEIDAGGGDDLGRVYDSSDDDVVIMNPNDVTLFGPEYSQTLRGFDYVHAYAKDGGYDTSHLYGDRYTYDTNWTRSFGEGTVNRAKFFEEVMANRERVNAPVYTPVTGTTTTMVGTHTLRRAIELGSGDTLIGTAILKRGETVQKNLTQDAQQGVTRLFVPDTTGYRVGDELSILAYTVGSESVIVTNLGTNWIDTENPLARDYSVANSAAVVNYFPLVRAVGTGITIEGLNIDGNRDPNVLQWQISGGGLIHMETTNSVIRDVTVIDSPSTGIYLLEGRDNFITNSVVSRSYGHGLILDQEIDTMVQFTTVSYNGGRTNGDGILVVGGAGHLIQNNITQNNVRYGLHPAGELTRGGVWIDNEANSNGRNGFHFCYNNFDILVTTNTFIDNDRSGVGGLGLGGVYADRFNVITNNVATGNWRYGIETNGGRNNIITDNDVRGNRLGGILVNGNHTINGNIS